MRRRAEERLRAERLEKDGIITDELRRLGWTEEELARRRKNDPGKMGLAVRLRRETTLSVQPIAARAYLGTSYTANKRLHQAMRESETLKTSQEPSGSPNRTKTNESMVW